MSRNFTKVAQNVPKYVDSPRTFKIAQSEHRLITQFGRKGDPNGNELPNMVTLSQAQFAAKFNRL